MSYQTDLTEREWDIIKHHFECGNYGNRSKYKKKDLVNAIFYLNKTGCQWRMLPKDFPPYSTVYSFYRRCKMKGTWEEIMKELIAKTRKKGVKI